MSLTPRTATWIPEVRSRSGMCGDALTATVGTAETVLASTLAFSPDGASLAVGDASGVVVYDVTGGPAEAVPKLRHGREPVDFVAFSPDSDTLAIQHGVAVTVLNPSSPQMISDSTVVRFALSPDGARLATSGYSDHIDVWDTATKEHMAIFSQDRVYPEGDVAFSPDGEWLGRGGWQTVVLHHVPQEKQDQGLEDIRSPREWRGARPSRSRPTAGQWRSRLPTRAATTR